MPYWQCHACCCAAVITLGFLLCAGMEIGNLNGIEVAKTAMEFNIKNYQCALHFVKLMKNLLLTEANVTRAKQADLHTVCDGISTVRMMLI